MGLDADDLVVLAVVSGNAYESNILGKAIVTRQTVKICLKIKEKGDLSKEAMLKEYLKLCQSRLNFAVAKRVCFNMDQGKVLAPLDRSKMLRKRDKSLALISEARALLVANRGNSGEEYLFKAHWSPNPLGPSIPPVLNVSPKVVTFDDDQYQEPKEVPEAKAVKPSSKAKAKRPPSGRSNRTKTADDANSLGPNTSKKNFSEATRAIASLSQRCGGYRTIHVGHLRGHIDRTILEKVQALWGANFLRNLSWPDTDIKSPMFTERVVEVVGEEGKQAVEGIEAWVNESLEDDPPNPPPPVLVFYEINRLLPGPYRWSTVPHTSFGDGYVTMSEECLFDLLFDIPSFQKTVREVAGVGLDARKMVIRAAFMKNPSEGRLLDEVFLLPPEMLAKSRYVLDDSPRRYVRTSSFKTNGLVLSLLWIDTTSKPPPPDRTVEDAINLPNIFKNKTLQSTHQDAWIIAIDPGATCIAGAVAFDPNRPDQRRNLAVTTKSLAEPTRRYRDWLEADKPEAICTAERECTKSDQETWAVFRKRFVRPYEIARAYYRTNKYKRKRWDADKAKRGELDRVLEGIVNMVDESMGHKLSGGIKVIVTIGMCDFSSTQSRHVMFIRGYLEHDERPTYLKPPSKDKNAPMKRKTDEGGTSRGGPSKSRKTR
ncbi:hypothetical protein SeLEV6574_g03397 [Synchytrium endobioticum]|uniref:Uncharacterized protein n=1 Tax=Synchytrium endobioticum TaxID=286115 RepID=A0A507D4B3_9FUNG|nr:hypothetical protein SeLEV6574_g03397 [Synchytrium endobioticum]